MTLPQYTTLKINDTLDTTIYEKTKLDIPLPLTHPGG